MLVNHKPTPGWYQMPRHDLCECRRNCGDDPATKCSLDGEWHVHPGEPCPVHPDAEGDE
jgi:hypothetical protein